MQEFHFLYLHSLSNEKAGITGRIWRRRSLHGVEKEVELDMHDDDAKNRVFVTKDHSLVIREITEQDGAYYFCYDVENERSSAAKMDILLDVGYRSTLEPTVLYMPVKLDIEIPKLLKICDKLQSIPPVSMYGCYAEWGPWSNCDNCGRLAERRKVGECRLQKYAKAQMETPEGKMIEADIPIVGVGCHSVLLNDIPGAKRILNEIPNIVLIEKCEVSCENYVQKAKKMIAYKRSSYLKKVKMKIANKMKQVDKVVKAEVKEAREGTSLTLFCPGTTLDTKVKWKLKEKVLNADKLKARTAGRVYIDATDALHIKALRATDSGEYVCTLLGVEIGLVRLKVKSVHKAFDPTSNFGLFTIGMLFSFVIWIIFMCVKWKSFMLQRRVQRKRELKKGTQSSTDVSKELVSSDMLDYVENESSVLLDSEDEGNISFAESSI